MTFSFPLGIQEKTGPSVYERMMSAARLASDADVMVKTKKKTACVDWRLEKSTAILRAAYQELVKRRRAAPGTRVKIAPFLRDFSLTHDIWIPVRTFKRFINNGGCVPPPPGRRMTLVKLLEDRIVTFAKFRWTFGKALTWSHLCLIAQCLAKSLNNILGGEDKSLSDFKASDGWLRRFRKAYEEEITGRKPELASVARAMSANPHSIRNEVETRGRALAMIDERNNNKEPGTGDPSAVPPLLKWNTDETGVWGTTARLNVICPTGIIDNTVVGEDHGAKISVALLICASGHAAAPYYILPGKKDMTDELDPATGRLYGIGDDSGYGYTEGGNMTEELWGKEYSKHLVKEIRRVVPSNKWVILTMDQYGAHVNSIEALEYLTQNKVLAYSPHAHSTWFTQPLDQHVIRSTKARYRQLLLEQEMYYTSSPSKWELPELFERAWNDSMSGPKGERIIRGAFEVVGLHPFNKDFVKSTKHLHLLSAPFDDGLERQREELKDGFPVCILLARESSEPYVVARGRVLLSITHLHRTIEVEKDECVVEVDEVMDLSCLGGDVPLLHEDPYERWSSVKEAWVGCQQTKFMTIWKRDMVRTASGDDSRGPAFSKEEVRLVKKAAGVPTMFGVAACTNENMNALASHPNLSSACGAFMNALRGGDGGTSDDGADHLPAELDGETGVEVMRHLLGVGGPLLAAAQASFPQLKESKRAAKRAASGAGGPTVPKRQRTNAFLRAMGQTSSCPKIHNGDEEMGKKRAYAANKANTDEAMAIHSSGRNDILLTVNNALREAGIITTEDVMKGKTPTATQLDDYIKKGGDGRILAWRQYRDLHNRQGKPAKAYPWIFDFVHGGAENHRTIKEGQAFELIIDDKSGVAKAPKRLSMVLPPAVSTISLV